MANRYLTAGIRARGEKAVAVATKHATKSRDAQDASVRMVVGVTYVSGVYAKTFVKTHFAKR